MLKSLTKTGLMLTREEENATWVPSTDEEKELVRIQMNRLLETRHFKKSRRYPALFRFLIEETLEGRGEFLKERLLGIHVFDRAADYDTASDPIVRVTIAEIRKRIAQYYHEEAHASEMRIELLPGSYAPEFRPRHQLGTISPNQDDATLGETGNESKKTRRSMTVVELPADAGTRTHRALRYGLGLIAILSLACSGMYWRLFRQSAVNDFWQPILASHKTIMFCLPTAYSITLGDTPFNMDGTLKSIFPYNNQVLMTPDKTFLQEQSLGENVVFSDVLATVGIAGYFATQKHDSRYRLSTKLTLDDLRQGPSVLIGGLDNQWSLRALAPLRYKFFGDNKRNFWIVDSKNPANHQWSLALDTPYSQVRHDYAIIARLHDEDTGEVEVIVAGIGMCGTAAAGELLVNPQQLEELKRRVGAGFKSKDFEAVLSTDVVDGIAGEARIVAVSVR
jgi:hypothetical protein